MYESPDGDSIPAYLLIPSGKPAVGGFPAALALHPTTENGKDDVCLTSGRANRRYGLELVRRGFAVLAGLHHVRRPNLSREAPFQTAPFYQRHPDWTAVGKMLSDHMAGVDVLSSLPQVNPHRIGVIGHSLGGYNGWFLAGIDRRIKAVVSSCGFTMFRGDPEPNRWGLREWFSHIPSITDSLSSGSLPFEWHEIAALAAPVPMLMWCGTQDPIFPNWREIATGLGSWMVCMIFWALHLLSSAGSVMKDTIFRRISGSEPMLFLKNSLRSKIYTRSLSGMNGILMSLMIY